MNLQKPTNVLILLILAISIVAFFMNNTKVSKTSVAVDQSQDLRTMAQANGLKPSRRILDAILAASEAYKIDATELAAIAIVETGLGKNAKPHFNSNGTMDRGLFQINTVNVPKCIEYNLDSPEGSALCAAKLLSELKVKRADYIGVYHSKTIEHKTEYMQKVSQVLAQTKNKN